MDLGNTSLKLAKSTAVFDSNQRKVGELDDVIIRISNPNKITKIVVTNPEKNADVPALFSDDRLVIPLEFISDYSPGSISIKHDKEVIHKLNQDTDRLKEGEFLYSKVATNEVKDSNGETMGRLKTVFLGEQPGLIVGDAMFGELLEEIGLSTETDLMIDLDEVELVDDVIVQLKQDKENYETIIRDTETPDLDRVPKLNYPFRTHPPH